MAATRFHQINRPQRLSDAVGSSLEKRIRSGALTPGERLPTEAQLGAQFAVSRAVVREAVARLKAEGLVDFYDGDTAQGLLPEAWPLWSVIWRYHWTQTFPAGAVVRI